MQRSSDIVKGKELQQFSGSESDPPSFLPTPPHYDGLTTKQRTHLARGTTDSSRTIVLILEQT